MREPTPVRILLVEDNEIDRMAVERLFAKESLPYDLVVAGTVAEATSIWFFRELSTSEETMHERCEVTVRAY